MTLADDTPDWRSEIETVAGELQRQIDALFGESRGHFDNSSRHERRIKALESKAGVSQEPE